MAWRPALLLQKLRRQQRQSERLYTCPSLVSESLHVCRRADCTRLHCCLPGLIAASAITH